MLFCIAALGSTWGAYALWFERLVGGSDRTEIGYAAETLNTQKHSIAPTRLA